MARIELLNNIDHKDLRVITTRSADYGDNIWYTPTFPHEFKNLQAHYPIFFTKNTDSGKFQAVAVFGFENPRIQIPGNSRQSLYSVLKTEKTCF